jgi:serine/threonine-protein kinase
VNLRASLEAALQGRYHITGELGEGATAVVFLARELKFERQVAIKALRPEIAVDVGAERFLREIQLAAGLQHPHILPVYDSGAAGNVLWYAMPRVDGQTLRQRLDREKQLPLEDTLHIARGVASALDFAHQRGVIHRDVKPENIMLHVGEAMVSDFGVAVAMSGGERRLTQAGLMVGTPTYMSPEQGAGDPQLDGRSDQYSLAIVVYEMLAGQPPFTEPTAMATIAARLTDPVPPLTLMREGLAPEIEWAVLKALSVTPADRFHTVADFDKALADGAAAPARRASATQPPGPSIAVLPFQNLSPDSDTEYFSDGMTEEIITALTKVRALRVAARTSSFAFKGKHENPRTVGRLLNVANLLEGSVRRAGSRLRVSAQLTSASDGYQLWSDRFDRTLDDVFEVQDEIARAIVEALKVKLLGSESQALSDRGTEDTEAFELYLMGRFHWNKRTEAGLRKAAAFFERAIAKDPAYALAMAGLADCYAILGEYGLMAPSEAMPQAKENAARALILNAGLAEAHTTLALVRAIYEWNWPAAEAAFTQALELAPRYATARQWYAVNFLVPHRRFEDAALEIERARRLDPLSLPITTTAGVIQYFGGRFAAAVQEYQRALEMDPGFAVSHFFMGRALAQQGDFAAAAQALRRAVELSGGDSEMTAALAYTHARAGTEDEARSLLSRLESRARERYLSPVILAEVYAGLGEAGRALEALERAADLRSADLHWLDVDPVFEPLRGEARFRALVARIGLADGGAAQR